MDRMLGRQGQHPRSYDRVRSEQLRERKRGRIMKEKESERVRKEDNIIDAVEDRKD